MEDLDQGTISLASTAERSSVDTGSFAVFVPKLSKWQCFLFGNSPGVNYGLAWRPVEGAEPNWFWRWMQYLAFGNLWIKDR